MTPVTKTFETLYQLATDGKKLKQWTISVQGNEVTTEYGYVGGKIQTTVDVVKAGKNIGRANGTTPETQALAQAQQQFDAKLKKGYVRDQAAASAQRNTLDGIEPMLAFPIESKSAYVSFPALAQPKLDGIRCLAIAKGGEVKLFTRTQKPISTVPHIVKELAETFGSADFIVLDGELYNHRYKKDFNKIVSLIRRDEIHPDHELVQYHIYDVVGTGSWGERTAGVAEVIANAKFLKAVETKEVKSMAELEAYQQECILQGYEGCMYRNSGGIYEHKRSTNLLKVKSFKDAEFKVIGYEEGHGKLMGKVGCWVCETGKGQQFKAKPSGSQEDLPLVGTKEAQEKIGKLLTVKYQQLTPDGVPRFPVAMRFREEGY